MTRHPGAATPRAGFTLVEMLIAMTLLSVVMATTVAAMRAQTRSFRQNGEQNDVLMNLRFTLQQVDQVARTAGSGSVARQPMLVYGDENTLVVNTNFSSDVDDGLAVNVTPDLPAGANTALRVASPITIPGTAITYPAVDYNNLNGTPSRAETITFYFRPDSTTADADDFVLLERVNAMPPELVARNLKRVANRDFFEYFTTNTASSVASIQQVTRARTPGLPLWHSVAQHGTTADVGASALVDSIRTVRLNVVSVNGQSGAAARQTQGTLAIRLANNGLVQLQACGDDPILTTTLTATPNLATDPPQVRLSWNASADETSGERDITQYNIYFRRVGITEWSAFTVLPAAGLSSYTITYGNGLVRGQTYQYAITAQDCTPRESVLRTSTSTIVN